MATQFKLPHLGENIEAGDVVSVLVQKGDVVSKGQTVLELETDKAVVEVPVDVDGTVEEVHVKEGDKVAVGEPVLTLAESEPSREPARQKKESAEEAPEKAPAAQEAAPEELPQEEPEVASEKKQAPSPRAEVVEFRERRPEREKLPAGRIAPASPAVRRLAREIGVDINEVQGTGPKGRISMADVKAHSKRLHESRAGLPAGTVAVELPDFTRWGEVERESFSNVRRKTAEQMSLAWATIPHVTQYDRADITDLEEARKRYAPRAEAAGGKLTLTAILLKVVASALRVFPQFNASIDVRNQEIIYKKYYHLGVAVDTERGLLVPVLRDVDRKNILQLSVELSSLAEKARNRKISPEDLQGACFTITNLGGIGGTAFSPIVNPPEVAILGVSRASLEPVHRDGQFVPRLMLPLSLSYDHRLIDGADAARFLRWVAEALEDPFRLALEG